jgi:hypothetical protein
MESNMHTNNICRVGAWMAILVNKKLREEVRKLSRTIKRQDWDTFVKSLEYDITEAQRI